MAWTNSFVREKNSSMKQQNRKTIHHFNDPVRRGLVLSPEEWKWSSAGWYRGNRDVELAIDDFGFSSSVRLNFTNGSRTNKFVHATHNSNVNSLNALS